MNIQAETKFTPPPSIICVICQDPLAKENYRILSTRCAVGAHAYHEVCLKEWLGGSSECPMCYSQISINNCRPLFLSIDEEDDKFMKELKASEDLQIRLAITESNLAQSQKKIAKKDKEIGVLKTRLAEHEKQSVSKPAANGALLRTPSLKSKPSAPILPRAPVKRSSSMAVANRSPSLNSVLTVKPLPDPVPTSKKVTPITFPPSKPVTRSQRKAEPRPGVTVTSTTSRTTSRTKV